MTSVISDNRRARVGYEDLREWIVEAERLGELVRAAGYSWQEDIGMAAELLQHDARAPAALFDDIPGYPKGFRVLTNFFGGRRQNMTLGFAPELGKAEGKVTEKVVEITRTLLLRRRGAPGGTG